MVDKKDTLDKIQTISSIIGAIAIPIIISVFGYWITLSIKDREVSVKMIEISIGILRQDPNKSNDIPEIREWAIQVLEKYSPVPLSSSLKEKLKYKQLSIVEQLAMGVNKIIITPGHGGIDYGAPPLVDTE